MKLNKLKKTELLVMLGEMQNDLKRCKDESLWHKEKLLTLLGLKGLRKQSYCGDNIDDTPTWENIYFRLGRLLEKSEQLGSMQHFGDLTKEVARLKRLATEPEEDDY